MDLLIGIGACQFIILVIVIYAVTSVIPVLVVHHSFHCLFQQGVDRTAKHPVNGLPIDDPIKVSDDYLEVKVKSSIWQSTLL